MGSLAAEVNNGLNLKAWKAKTLQFAVVGIWLNAEPSQVFMRANH